MQTLSNQDNDTQALAQTQRLMDSYENENFELRERNKHLEGIISVLVAEINSLKKEKQERSRFRLGGAK